MAKQQMVEIAKALSIKARLVRMMSSGLRNSCESHARNSVLCRSASRSASSAALCAVMSVFVPNQRTTRPVSSQIGKARERNQR